MELLGSRRNAQQRETKIDKPLAQLREKLNFRSACERTRDHFIH
jgi:hypothetical protein